jgi:acetyltransferase
MATDACERFDIPLYNDSETLRDIFAPVTPSFGSTKNPIDITGGATAPEYSQALDVVLNHDKIGAAMALYCETAVFPARDLERMLEETSRRFDEHKRPVLFAAVGGEDLEQAIARLRRINVPVFPDVDQAVSCMGKLFEHYRQRRYRSDTFEDCVIDTQAIDTITENARASGRSFLSADEARAIMQTIGIRMPASCVVKSLDEALKRCEEVGYPLVMKVVSPDIIHKSDAGGVVLDLHNKEEVLDAWQAIMQRCLAFLPGARIDGIEMSSMIEPGVETIIGARRDPVFGPIAMFGQGGIYVEVMKDVSFRALPLNRLEILRMMKQTRTYPLLLGVRGEAKKDIEGVLETIIKIGALVRACDYISDIEINPLVVFEENSGVNALDVRILLETRGKERP